jgi:hypothetical protein
MGYKRKYQSVSLFRVGLNMGRLFNGNGTLAPIWNANRSYRLVHWFHCFVSITTFVLKYKSSNRKLTQFLVCALVMPFAFTFILRIELLLSLLFWNWLPKLAHDGIGLSWDALMLLLPKLLLLVHPNSKVFPLTLISTLDRELEMSTLGRVVLLCSSTTPFLSIRVLISVWLLGSPILSLIPEDLH